MKVCVEPTSVLRAGLLGSSVLMGVGTFLRDAYASMSSAVSDPD